MTRSLAGRLIVLALIGALVTVASDSSVTAEQDKQASGLIDACRMPAVLAQPGVPYYGTSGPDVIGAAGPGVIVYGRGGDDVICASSGDDIIRGGSGDDIIFGFNGHDNIKGGSGHDQIRSGPGHDIIKAGKGNDRIRGGSGNDDIRGGSGNDDLRGNKGKDIITGGSGNDHVRAGGGKDTVLAGRGDDTIEGGKAGDTIYSGTGLDTVDGQSGIDTCVDSDYTWITITGCEDALGRVPGGFLNAPTLWGVAGAGIETLADVAVPQVTAAIGAPSSTGAWTLYAPGGEIRTYMWDNLWVDFVREPGREAVMKSAYLANTGRHSAVGGITIGTSTDELFLLYPNTQIVELDQGTLWYVPSWSEFQGELVYDLTFPTLYGYVVNGVIDSVAVGAPQDSLT
jgi:hypothetical protein